MLSNRMKNFDLSNVRRMFEMASRMKNPTDLSLGVPDFDVPEVVKEAAIEAIRAGKNRYTVAAGIPELRAAINNTLAAEGVTPQATMVTAGASGALVLAFLAMADETTEVLIPDPYFVTYGHMVQLAGAKVRYLDTYPQLYPHFRLTSEMLERASADSKKAGFAKQILLFNSPGNPSGIVYTGQEQKTLASTTKQLGIQVISDEVYNYFCYDTPFESWLKYDSNALLVRTFGKTAGMPGWRTGFASGPKEIIDAMISLQQLSFVCVNTPAQWGSIAALGPLPDRISAYRKKRNFAYEQLKHAYDMPFPEGAFYLFPKIPTSTAEKFYSQCIQHEILIVPGSTFSQKDTHFRVSYAVSDQTLEKGIEILLKIAKGRIN